MSIFSYTFVSMISFIKFLTSFCKRQQISKITTISDINDVIEDITESNENTEEKKENVEQKEEEKKVTVEDDIFTSVDFTKKCIYYNSSQISELLDQNKDKLELAKDINDKVFYFSRMERFPIYGIKKIIKKELDKIVESENHDELLLAILNALDWELTMPYYIDHFYRCNILYYKLISARPILQKIPIYYTTKHPITGQERCVYRDVKEFFLERGKDEKESVNIRADCLDALFSFCCETKEDVKKVIDDMGNLYTENKEQTIYTNAQNVHSKGIQITAIASLKNLAYYHSPDANLDELYVVILKKLCDNNEKRDKVIKALKRVLIDPTRINALSISQIISLVWKEIERQTKYRDELENRLIEELYEADETCSSGFFTRLINVLTGFSPLVKINIYPEEEAVVKITGFIKKKLSMLQTLDKERLILEITDCDPDPESFRNKLKSETREELNAFESLTELVEKVGEEKMKELIENKLDAFFGK